MTEGFTIAGSTLSLLKVGEQGTVTRIASLDETLVRKLKSMGVVPGASVTLKQRSPDWVIQVGDHRFGLSKSTAQAIYLRLQHSPVSANVLDQLNQVAIALLKRFSTGKSTNYPQPLCSSVDNR